MRISATLALFLCGCSTLFPSAATYAPVIAEIADSTQYAADLKSCHAVADGYRPGLNVGSVVQQGLSGAANNVAAAVINPLVPAAGAAGGAASAVVSSVGLNGVASIKVLVKCLEEKARRDRSFIIADPNG